MKKISDFAWFSLLGLVMAVCIGCATTQSGQGSKTEYISISEFTKRCISSSNNNIELGATMWRAVNGLNLIFRDRTNYVEYNSEGEILSEGTYTVNGNQLELLDEYLSYNCFIAGDLLTFLIPETTPISFIYLKSNLLFCKVQSFFGFDRSRPAHPSGSMGDTTYASLGGTIWEEEPHPTAGAIRIITFNDERSLTCFQGFIGKYTDLDSTGKGSISFGSEVIPIELSNNVLKFRNGNFHLALGSRQESSLSIKDTTWIDYGRALTFYPDGTCFFDVGIIGAGYYEAAEPDKVSINLITQQGYFIEQDAVLKDGYIDFGEGILVKH